MKFGFLSEVPTLLRRDLLTSFREVRRLWCYSLFRCFTVVFERRYPGITLKTALAARIQQRKEAQRTIRLSKNLLRRRDGPAL